MTEQGYSVANGDQAPYIASCNFAVFSVMMKASFGFNNQDSNKLKSTWGDRRFLGFNSFSLAKPTSPVKKARV